MTPIKFPGHNVVFGENQPEYRPLPALLMPDGEVYTCWELTSEELEEVQKTGKVYVKQLTFNQGLNPINVLAALGDDMTIL